MNDMPEAERDQLLRYTLVSIVSSVLSKSDWSHLIFVNKQERELWERRELFIQVGKKKKRENKLFFSLLEFHNWQMLLPPWVPFGNAITWQPTKQSSTEAPCCAKGTALQQLRLRVCSLRRAEKLPPRPVRSRQEVVPMGRVKGNIKTSRKKYRCSGEGWKSLKKVEKSEVNDALLVYDRALISGVPSVLAMTCLLLDLDGEADPLGCVYRKRPSWSRSERWVRKGWVSLQRSFCGHHAHADNFRKEKNLPRELALQSGSF